MVSRREFIQAGAAAGVFSALPLNGFANGFSGGSEASLAGVFRKAAAMVERRFPEGETFHTALLGVQRALPLAVHQADDDASSLLYRMTDTWKEETAPFFGLTRDHTLLLTEQMAAPYGLLPVYQGVHRYGGDGILHHTLTGPREWVAVIGDALAATGEERWSGRLARQLAACSGRNTPKIGLLAKTGTETAQTIAIAGRRPPASPGHFVSWIFLPSQAVNA